MKTQKIKVLLAVAVIGMSCTFKLPVEANGVLESNYNEEISVQYVQLGTVSSNLNISGGNACYHGVVTAVSGKQCSIAATLQKKTSSGWKNIKTWNNSGIQKCSVKGQEPISKGVKYRLKVVGKSGGESSTKYSDTKSY